MSPDPGHTVVSEPRRGDANQAPAIPVGQLNSLGTKLVEQVILDSAIEGETPSF
jgi:hypothetical protein